MAVVLLTWELGAGLGHMLPMRPLAEELVRAGHRVFVALRDLTRAGSVFGRSGVRFLQAPYKPGGPVFFPRALSHAHLMANVGFGSAAELYPFACAWRRLLDWTRPDLVVFDHSPTALLAARDMSARRALTGFGFFCPPDRSPLPAYADDPNVNLDRLRADEQRALGAANRVLRQWGRAPLEHLGELYSDVDETFLTTFPELDHYGERKCRYWGPVLGEGGKAPQWPAGEGKRLYAYLKPFPGLPDLLRALKARGYPTIVYVDGVGPDVQREFASPTIRFEHQRLDLRAVGRECDLAIHNANHGTLCSLLLAGKPMLQVPLTQEQAILARRVAALGAGESAPASAGKGTEIEQKLDLLLTDGRYGEAARHFQQAHTDFDPQRQRREMLRRAEELLRLPAPPSCATNVSAQLTARP